MKFLDNDIARCAANEYGSFLYNVLERLLESDRTLKDFKQAEFCLRHVTNNINRMYEKAVVKEMNNGT